MRRREFIETDRPDPSQPVTAILNLNKEHQVLRLVNATNRKVVFAVDLDLSTTPITSMSINPSNGVLMSGDFTYIRIKNLDFPRQPKDAVTLVIRYKRSRLADGEPVQVFGRINLKMERIDGGGDKRPSYGTYCLIFRVLRASFLVALIAYNVAVIKFEIFGRPVNG